MQAKIDRPIRARMAVGGMILGLLWLTACQPPGPRALLEGERLIKEEKYHLAVEQLRKATELLPGNAQAWNHLGLALQGMGQKDEAVTAYQQALRLDRNLFVARFNVGVALLESNRALEAATELTAYTTLQPYAANGWSQLGTAFLRQKKWDDAERAFISALRLEPKDAETLNDLGIVSLQKRKAREAAQWFSQALKAQADYGPALLNSAIVSQHYFNAKPLALERYRQYAALKPEPPNAAAVREIIQRLEVELQPKSVAPPVAVQPALTNQPVITNRPLVTLNATNPIIGGAASTNQFSKPQETAVKAGNATALVPKTNTPITVEPVPKTPPPTNLVGVVATNKTPVRTTNVEPPPEPLEVVRLGEDTPPPAVRDVAENSGASVAKPAFASPSSNTNSSPSQETVAPLIRTARRDSSQNSGSFWQKANPIRWFGRKDGGNAEGQSGPKTNQPPPRPVLEETSPVRPTLPEKSAAPVAAPRYAFQLTEPPGGGDAVAAEKLFAKGLEAHQAERFGQAVTAYQQALAANPASFEAAYNLALAGYQMRDWPLALRAGETAVRIDPGSADALFNFAMTLEAAGYFPDAVGQLERGLGATPQDARMHLAAAALYSQHLADPAKALAHYRRVLELQPNHPQADSIRRWLAAHP